MKTISIINYKGGVGKTTLTANLGAELARLGKKVLLIDLDSQTNLTFSFLKVDEWANEYESDKTIKSWFYNILDGADARTSFEDLIVAKNGVDLICSHLGLIDVDMELATGLSSASERQHRQNFIKTFSYLRNELRSLGDRYDAVLFDCPPNLGAVTKNALVASDYYLIPARMDYLSTLGINHLRNHVGKLVEDYNTNARLVEGGEEIDPECLGVVATMVHIRKDRPISTQEGFVQELRRSDIPMFDSMVRHNPTLFGDAPRMAFRSSARDIPQALHTRT